MSSHWMAAGSRGAGSHQTAITGTTVNRRPSAPGAISFRQYPSGRAPPSGGVMSSTTRPWLGRAATQSSPSSMYRSQSAPGFKRSASNQTSCPRATRVLFSTARLESCARRDRNSGKCEVPLTGSHEPAPCSLSCSFWGFVPTEIVSVRGSGLGLRTPLTCRGPPDWLSMGEGNLLTETGGVSEWRTSVQARQAVWIDRLEP